MKLIKLHLQNFQGHKNTIIDFTGGLNIIVGPSDTGKSAILRSLRRLIRDDPKGKTFISKWAKTMTISLTFDVSGVESTIIRKLTPTKNLYYLENQEYGGFGKTIPIEIQNALNMQLVTLETGDTLDLHFTGQYDMPFMISKGSSGTRSKILGKIAGLHVLDRAISRINSDIREENSKLKHIHATIDSLQYELEDFPDLWHESELINTLPDQINAVNIKIENKNQLILIVDNLDILTIEASAITARLKQLNALNNFKIPPIMDRILKYQELSKIVKNLYTYQDQIKSKEAATFPEITADFKGIEDRINEHLKISQIYEKLMCIMQEVKPLQHSGNTQNLNNALTEYNAILNDLDICPTCKSPMIKSHKHEEIIK